jgi:nitrate reductase gamma subunit
MFDFFNTLVFGIYPYIALVVLILGTIIRYDREPYTWRSGSSQLLRRKQLILGSVLFLAIIAGGIAGVMAIVGATLLVHRRLFDPRVRAASSMSDTLIIMLLWLQLLLGLGTIPVSFQHLDGHEMVKFMTWAQGIFTFNPEASSYVADASPVFRAHIFLGLTILLLFPFTRLVHMLSVPVRYMWRPGYQVVRKRNARPAASRISAE